jgi:hypothetical protein
MELMLLGEADGAEYLVGIRRHEGAAAPGLRLRRAPDDVVGAVAIEQIDGMGEDRARCVDFRPGFASSHAR